MGGSKSKSKVTSLKDQSQIEMNPMAKENDEETAKADKPTVEKKPGSQLVKRIITIVITIVSLVEPIYSSYVSWQAYQSFGDMSDQLKSEVTDRYGQWMIQDIKMDTSCNGKYEPLFMYIFKGTNLRCDCRGKLNDEITPHFCSPDQVAANCVQYNLINEAVLSMYPIGINDDLKQQLCFSQYLPQTYKSAKSWPSVCPSGQKMCGGKSKESYYCMPEAEKCPINSMIVALTNPDALIYDEQLQFNSTHILFYSRKSDYLPLNYNKVTSGEGPCYNVTEENTYVGRVDPFIFKEQRKPCEIDPRWNRVAEIGEYTFFQSNDIKPEVYFSQIWNDYPISNNYRYGFYVAHYPDWKFEKRDLLIIVTEFVENRDNIMYFQTGLFILNLVNLGINVLLSFQLVRQYCNAVDEDLKDTLARKKNYINNFIKIGQIAACIFQIVLIQNYLDTFKDCVKYQVSDPRTNGILGVVSKYMEDKVFEADKKMIISNCVGFAIAILGLVYSIVTKKKEQKK